MFTVKVYSQFRTIDVKENPEQNIEKWESRVDYYQCEKFYLEHAPHHVDDVRPRTTIFRGTKNNSEEIEGHLFCVEMVKHNQGEWCHTHNGKEHFVWQIIVENSLGKTTEIIRTDTI